METNYLLNKIILIFRSYDNHNFFKEKNIYTDAVILYEYFFFLLHCYFECLFVIWGFNYLPLIFQSLNFALSLKNHARKINKMLNENNSHLLD